VKRLVEEEGVNPEEPDPRGLDGKPLHCAANRGHYNVMTYLLDECGVDVNQVDKYNRNALYAASHGHQVGCIRFLLQRGADPNMPTCGTPLMICIYHADLASITDFLEDGRCDLENKARGTGDTAILIAAARKYWDIVELLLSYHASPIATRNDGHNLHALATEHKAPPHTLQLIETAVFEHHQQQLARLLHRARRINEARHSPATDGPTFLRPRADDDLPLPRVELTFPDVGYEEGQEKLRAVVQHVVGMKEDGSVGGEMLKEHVVELMDMLLPVWDEERTQGEDELMGEGS
jgi:ankyrin repeat protein